MAAFSREHDPHYHSEQRKQRAVTKIIKKQTRYLTVALKNGNINYTSNDVREKEARIVIRYTTNFKIIKTVSISNSVMQKIRGKGKKKDKKEKSIWNEI